MKLQETVNQMQLRWNTELKIDLDVSAGTAAVHCEQNTVPSLCGWLFNTMKYHFTGLVPEEGTEEWKLIYFFTGETDLGSIQVQTSAPLDEETFQSVSPIVHAVDWHEREAEDLFGLIFEGHPRLGDFVLHDDAWQEGLAPMRAGFDSDLAHSQRKPKSNWKPRRVLDAPGAFVMPVGPVFSGEAESSHFLLETIGEEIVRALPRLFFKYRGVEKLAEGKSINEALLLSERFAGTTAFSHALTFCTAAEKLSAGQIPERAEVLRIFFAEMERFRHHIGIIEGICSSTGLVVAASQAGILEERMLRLTGKLTGHRYFFGLAVPGGLSRDIDAEAIKEALKEIKGILHDLNTLEKLLKKTSSFLDRLEDVGIITPLQAQDFELAGPVARGSHFCNDVRKLRPYGMYPSLHFEVPCEREGDGYARLRIFFEEVRQAADIMDQAAAMIKPGPVYTPYSGGEGTALAGVETPGGASWQWLRVDKNNRIIRYRIMPPSFANWHGFHLAVEKFAFQDFPIIKATLGLSVAENDR